MFHYKIFVEIEMNQYQYPKTPKCLNFLDKSHSFYSRYSKEIKNLHPREATTKGNPALCL